MSKKNVIKLTESELKKVITESVRNILSELDYKTYLETAKKREAQGRSYSASELRDWADKQFNKQYGSDNGVEVVGRDNMTGVSLRRRDVANPTYREYVNDNGELESMTVDPYAQQTKVVNHRSKAGDNLQRAHDEYQNYTQGNYQYSKDKGWHLK